jgi:hypothetical protein
MEDRNEDGNDFGGSDGIVVLFSIVSKENSFSQ